MLNSKLLTAMAICLGASAGFAQTVLRTPASLLQGYSDIHLAQSVADKLSVSDIKRIKFYSERVMRCLAEIAAEDAAATVGSDESVVALRGSISRLVDAGKRSGLNLTETADFFLLLTEDKLGLDIPLALQDRSGKLDTRNLFAGVTGRSAFGTSGKSNQDYLDQLNAASAKIAPLDGTAGQGSAPAAVERTAQNRGIQIPDGADSAAREILQRVEFRDGRWVIEVVAGDTLARYATALYGDPLAYRLIYQANDTVLSSPSDLTVGTVLALPRGN